LIHGGGATTAHLSFRKSEFEDVPGWDRLERQLREWLADPGLTLSTIREWVFEHILEHLDMEDEEAHNEAMNLAFEVIELLIWYLPVDELNCGRLKAYIKEFYSYVACL
jgi:hypothetical protein